MKRLPPKGLAGKAFDDPELLNPVVAMWNNTTKSIHQIAVTLKLPRERVRQVLLNARLVKSTTLERTCAGCERLFFPINKRIRFCSRQCSGRVAKPSFKTLLYDIDGAYALLFLPSGDIALVDTDDLPKINQYLWHISRPSTTRYVVGNKPGKYQSQVRLHRLILGFPRGQIDHRDCNGLDNRKHNLRLATSFQNQGNRRKNSGASSSIFKGVSFARNGWTARMTQNGRYFYIGRFPTEEDAARAYDRAALQYFGEFARLNFPADGIAKRAR